MTTPASDEELEFYASIMTELEKDEKWKSVAHLYSDGRRLKDIVIWYRFGASTSFAILIEKSNWTTFATAYATAFEEGKKAGMKAASNTLVHHLIRSPSQSSKDPVVRAKYRQMVLPEESFKGAFVALEMYVEFVKAANRMMHTTGESANTTTEAEAIRKTWSENVQAIEKYETILSRGREVALHSEAENNENQQSVLAAELIRFSVGLFKPVNDVLVVSHQHSVWETIDKKDQRFNVINPSEKFERRPATKRKLPSESDEVPVDMDDPIARVLSLTEQERALPTTNNSSNAVSEIKQTIDVLIWFPHSIEYLGNVALAAIEYTPNIDTDDECMAKANMCATNISSAHGMPCITVDICGGLTFEDWTISASAIVRKGCVFTGQAEWRRSLMFQGKGAEGLCGLAAGLVAARMSFPVQKHAFGRLLGPVVGLHDNKIIVKAYDDAMTRKPNLDLIRKNVDPDAILFESINPNRNLQLLQMKYTKVDWSTVSSETIFVKILGQLMDLHSDAFVHGDIRLANMLSTGALIDFDFAGKVGLAKYPPGFQLIDTDGKRHEEVETAIDDDSIEDLSITKEHDCFSMAFVMKLFEPKDLLNEGCWTKAAEHVEKSELLEAIELLSKKDFEVALKNSVRENIGTGGTSSLIP
jgi:hypothetical protein